LIEALTYRMGGHSTSDDPNAYRGPEDVAEWKERDPVERVRRYLVRQKAWSDEKQTALLEELQRQFKACVADAEKVAKPSLETMFEDVYAEPSWNLKEQREELLNGPRAPEH
jgi:2-oxoisovalerate dehydrogenase E1 component alpha subunit